MRRAFVRTGNIFGYVSLFLMFIFFGCTQECMNGDKPEKKVEKNKHSTTLQDVVNNAAAGEEIDLAEYESITDYNAVISKQLVIKNGSLSNAKLVIDSENVKLDKVKGVSVTTLSASSLTITDSSINELLFIGKNYSDNSTSRSSKSYSFMKESSVTMNGTSNVNSVTMNFSKAKLKISDGSSAETVAILDDAAISGKINKLVIKELNTAVTLEKANITNVVMDGFNSQLAVLDTETVLENVSINTECKILCNATMSEEPEKAFTSDGVLTVVDMTEKPQLERLSILSMPTNIFSDNGEIDFTGLKVGGLYENVTSKVYTSADEEENKEAFMKLETDYKIEVISEEDGIIKVRISKDGKECIFEMLDSEKIAKYTVKHCQENAENDNYEIIVTADTETKTGKVGELTNATPKTYEGYTVEPIEQVEINADGNTIVYVNYKRKTVTLTLNLDGGEIGGKSEMTISGKYGAKVPEVKSPTKDDYNFAGWNPQLPETFPAESTTYTAKWAGDGDYIITYELNGGTNAESNPLIYKETERVELAEATREDYIFGGWYTDEACTTEKTEIEKGSSGNITLYAKWIARTLEQTFEDGYSNQNNANANGVSYNTDKGYGVVTVHSPDSSGSVWDYYIKSENIKFEAGKNYTVSVDLKADKTSVVAIAAARADMFFTVGTEWTTCTFETGYLETDLSNKEQNCITIGSGLVGTLSISNLVITSTDENDNLPILSFYIEKAGIDAYLASNLTTKNIIEVEEAKDESGTKVLGYELQLNSTGVSLQLRDYVSVSGNKLNNATFNLATDNAGLNSAVVASVNSSSGYVSCWNKASVIGTSVKDCEVYFPSYIEGTSVVEECAVEGIISKNANNGITELAGNTITITNFEISNVADLAKADTGKTFAISINDKFNYSDTLPFTQEVTVPKGNTSVTFDVLLGDKVGGETSFNWDNVTRFLYQKTSGELIDSSSVVKYVITGDQNSPTYKLVNESESDVTCIITLTKDLKVEISDVSVVINYDKVNNIKNTIGDYIGDTGTASEKTIKVVGDMEGREDSDIQNISEGLKENPNARINLDLSGVTGLSEIPKSAFKGCENLVSITILAGVTTIGDSAFEDCKNLANITLPDCLVDIGDSAFKGCKNLKYTEYSNGNYLGNAGNPYLAFMSSKEATVTSIEINNATKIIAASAFAYCNELEEINIPDNVVTIGAQSFYNCFALKSITIPSSVTKIGVQAFYRITDNGDVSYPSVSFEDTNGWYCFDYDDNGEEKKTPLNVENTDIFESYYYCDWFKDVQ